MKSIALAAALATLATSASAYIQLFHPYGELVDKKAVGVLFWPASFPDEADCGVAPRVDRAGDEFTISIRRYVAGTPAALRCAEPARVTLGELPAGGYKVVLDVYDADGATLRERTQKEFRVRALVGSCNADPEIGSKVIAQHASLQPWEVAQKFAADPAFAALLDHPLSVRVLDIGTIASYAILDYPVLDDPVVKIDRLTSTAGFSSAGKDGRVCFAAPPADAVGAVVEYYHRGLDHFFYTLDAREIAALDAGTVIEGWARTEKSFRVVQSPGCPFARGVPAYRFYGKPGIGPDTHVFTIDREECYGVNTTGKWIYEGVPFWPTTLERDGTCTHASDVPLYRVWKPSGVSNHRFTTDRAVIAEMVALGWIDEGARMCVLPPK